MKKITFCEQNMSMGTQIVIDILEQINLKNYEIRVTRCLGECGECFSKCIVDFHGKLIAEDTPTELLNTILLLINGN